MAYNSTRLFFSHMSLYVDQLDGALLQAAGQMQIWPTCLQSGTMFFSQQTTGSQQGQLHEGSAAPSLLLQAVTWPVMAKPHINRTGSILHKLHWEAPPSLVAWSLVVSFCNRKGAMNWEQIMQTQMLFLI